MKRLSSPGRGRAALIAVGWTIAGSLGCAISFGGYELDPGDASVSGASGGASGTAGASGASASGQGGSGDAVGTGGSGASGASAGGLGGSGGNVGIGGAGGAGTAGAAQGGSAGASGGAGGAGQGGALPIDGGAKDAAGGSSVGGGKADASAGSGGTGGTGGTAGAGGTGSFDAGSDSGITACPQLPGPTMVPLPIPAGAPGAPGTYCIDHTEVTNTQYAAFLATNPSTGSQPSYCSWNSSFLPETLAGPDNCPNASSVYDVATYPQNPVACVDWCDAYAYCKSVGKRLCGAFGGGSVAFGSGTDAKTDEWYAACSVGGTFTFPYGNTFQPQYCNTLDFGQTRSVRVGFTGQCSGPMPYDFLYDMSGNVSEWQDACNGVLGSTDTCYARGGFWNSHNPAQPTGTSTSAACNAVPTALGTVSGVSLSRSRRSAEIGFRCCYDGK